MKENSALLDKALLHALHSMAGAEKRWERFRKSSTGEGDLAKAGGYEFGSMGGFMGAGMAYDYKGGQNPAFSVGLTGSKTSLKGKPLLAAVRRVLCLDYRQMELQLEEKQ